MAGLGLHRNIFRGAPALRGRNMTTFPELGSKARFGVAGESLFWRALRGFSGFKPDISALAASSITNVSTFDPSARVVENNANRRPSRALLKISLVLSIVFSPAWLVLRKLRADGRAIYVQECPL